MHDLPSADINSHMPGIADDIAGLRILQSIHRIALGAVRRVVMGQADAEVRIDAHHEAGTVRTVRQAAAAI